MKPNSVVVRGALCDEIAGALQALWERRPPSDEAMHQVRKDLKRARAALRLLRDTVGDAAYSQENVELRDAARPLSGVRDASVGLEVVRELLEREKKPVRRAMLLELRRTLREERSRARLRLLGGKRLAAIEYSLQDAGERAEYWRFPVHDAPLLRAGFERVYRKGRKTLKERPLAGFREIAPRIAQAGEVPSAGARDRRRRRIPTPEEALEAGSEGCRAPRRRS
jgi:hypothetical protein